MNRSILLLLGVALAVPASASGQTAAVSIQQALAALPDEDYRRDAAVIRWNADHTYDTLKEGTSRWVCYDRSEYLNRSPFAVQCTSVANLERVAQNRRIRAESADRREERSKLAEAEENDLRVVPEYGSVFFSMEGPDQGSAGMHITIAVPFATGASTGLPETNPGAGTWIMAAGTSTAHIMTPGH